MQCRPDFQQHALAVLPPLMIPESQLFDALVSEKLRSRLVVLKLLRQAVLEAVEFHRKPRQRAVEVQDVISSGMLTAEFETGEAAGLQSAPEFLFLSGLLAAKLAGEGRGVHAGKLLCLTVGRQERASSPRPSPPFQMEERGTPTALWGIVEPLDRLAHSVLVTSANKTRPLYALLMPESVSIERAAWQIPRCRGKGWPLFPQNECRHGTPVANLYVSMLERVGAPTERLGDSTGLWKELA